MNEIADARAKLRREMLVLRDGLDAEYRAEASAKIMRELVESEMWVSAGSVFIYCSNGSEVDTRALISSALKCGKALYLPKCYAKGEMKALRLRDIAELARGKYGILEPQGDEILSGAPDICITPGLAFDKGGARLGYGGGYYDRYLSGGRIKAAALAYPEQVIERVPVAAHDVPMDYIITPAGIISCDERA